MRRSVDESVVVEIEAERDRSASDVEVRDLLTEARKGLARWEAWHAKKFGTSFPDATEQPPDWAAWISAAKSWGVDEADRLFPDLHPSERTTLHRTVSDRGH